MADNDQETDEDVDSWNTNFPLSKDPLFSRKMLKLPKMIFLWFSNEALWHTSCLNLWQSLWVWWSFTWSRMEVRFLECSLSFLKTIASVTIIFKMYLQSETITLVTLCSSRTICAPHSPQMFTKCTIFLQNLGLISKSV